MFDWYCSMINVILLYREELLNFFRVAAVQQKRLIKIPIIYVEVYTYDSWIFNCLEYRYV